ncbi:hypothetical protein ACUH7Y_13945 [Clostridium beijerinckii]|uniref:DUF4367 domain-containing protein n=1 Tax=Clostridium beijerinckii TaxID=1520 RepID=A0A7X9SPJ8_CLOBE|nr:hypothetical protein [Clostridium beijerinckii]NMF05722.1 hypothetical protein [Clostridium beijerinckii]
MILSKKYKEELNKIVMNDDMKKRILQNVLAENKNDNNEEKEIKVETTMPKVKKYNVKRNMQMAAACGVILICLSVAKSYPMLFKHASNDLEQTEVEENHEDKNNDLKSGDDSELIDNNDSKEASDNDNKEEIAVNQNNRNNNKNDNNYNNGSNHVDKNTNNSSKAGHEGKYNTQSNSGSEEKKRETSENKNNDNNKATDNKAIENSNTSPKTNHKDDINNKEEKNPTSTDQKKASEDVKENKISEDNTDDSVSGTSVVMDKNVGYSQEYKTLDEAEKALNLKVNPLKTFPNGFKVENVSVISNEMIQVDYNNGNNNMIFRAGKSTDNISGDYNAYQVKNTVKVNGIDVTLEGNKNEEYNLATWKKDDISYSISTEDGINEKTMLDMII